MTLPSPRDLGIDLNARGRKRYQAYAVAYALQVCAADKAPRAVPVVNEQANHALATLGRSGCSPETVTRLLRSAGVNDHASFLRERYWDCGWCVVIGHRGLDSVVTMPDFKGVVPLWHIAAVRRETT